ncbi:unnamed protein product [Rotaria sp. Silwood2]|nr:unnamed protein product [Rotaria sp. Silwood2]
MNDSNEHHINSRNKKLREIFDNHFDRLEKDIQETFIQNKNSKKNDKDDKNKKDVDEILYEVMYCLQPAVRPHLTVFDLNSDTNLSETIFRSICRSREKLTKMKEQERKDQLEMDRRRLAKLDTQKRITDDPTDLNKIRKKDQNIERTRLLALAMKWDCIKIAKEYIFQNSLDSILSKDKYFIRALKDDLPNFVYEFLKLGIEPADIFFPKKPRSQERSQYAIFIEELYHMDLKAKAKTHLKEFIETNRYNTKSIINTVESLNLVLKNLIGDYMYELYFDTPEDEQYYRIKRGLIEVFVESQQDNYEDTKNEKSLLLKAKNQTEHNYIMRDLFLWAILMNRINMAKVLLSFMKNRICPALIATKILKKYYSIANYGDLKNDYIKDAEYFEQYAIRCLDLCDDNNVHKACEIILQQNELYGYVTCLQVASDADDQLFIAEPTCVQAMNNIWYDKLHPEQTNYYQRLALFSGIISLGLLAPVFVKYRENKEVRTNLY